MADCWYCVELGVPPEPEARRGLCEAHASLQEAHGAVALLRAPRVLDPEPDRAQVEREAAATDLAAADRLLEAIGEQDRTRAAFDAAIRALKEAQQ
jgi:hypothetical protein